MTRFSLSIGSAITVAAVVASASLGAAPPTPRAHVITVRMTHDSTGMRFHPARIVAVAGDTLRFVNGVGRHDVDFTTDSNPRGVTLPARTPLLEHAGESTDMRVALPPGTYYFQCDPHAAMGMTGHLVIEKTRRAG